MADDILTQPVSNEHNNNIGIEQQQRQHTEDEKICTRQIQASLLKMIYDQVILKSLLQMRMTYC